MQDKSPDGPDRHREKRQPRADQPPTHRFHADETHRKTPPVPGKPPAPPADAPIHGDATYGEAIAPPPADEAPTLLPPAPGLPPGSAPPIVIAPPADAAATLSPTDTASTLPPPARTNVAPAAPSAQTLDPGDSRAKEYVQAVEKNAKGPLAGGGSFGDYDLIEPIAKGGMGIVYKARQRKLNRLVAVKMILAGQFADQSDIDRFYAEAAAAGNLSHPHIVAIHEVGEVNGQHFFSMDYVEGQSLADLVRESPLPPRRAAELLRTIAETMQFAHDSGIVHRDLKPSNVLMDKKQRPMITDFGLAKHVTGQSQLTMAGAVVGTPSYMPPEQAAGKGDEVGPWSDLYSLGAVLYEMLTGRPPFRAASPFETIRQVLDTEPLSPRLVNPNVPRDLETVCLKCLQKERTRRYDSCQELADELARYLRGEPIQARPISQVARFWRLVQRHPVTSSAIAAAVLMLITATIVSTGFYVQASSALVAKSNALTARTKALEERTVALTESEQSLREAIGAVNDLFTRVSEDTLLNQPGMQPLRKDLLQLALGYYKRFLEQRANDPRVQDELAAAYFRVGLIAQVLQSPDDALPHFEEARRMQANLLVQRPNDPKRMEALGHTHNALGKAWVVKQDYGAARREYGESAKIRAQLAAAHQNEIEYQRVLANTYMNIGVAEYNAGHLPAAREQFEKSQEIRKAALARDPENSKLRNDLGKGYYSLGNLDWEDQREAEAEGQFKSATELFEKLAAEQPADLDNQMRLAICYRFLGDFQSQQAPAEARHWYQQALDRLKPLARQNPDVNDYQTAQAGVLMNLSLLESQNGKADAAKSALEEAKGILAPLAQKFAAVPRYQRDLAVTLRELARQQMAADETDAAAENLGEAVRILKTLAKDFPDEPDYAQQLEQAEALVSGGSR